MNRLERVPGRMLTAIAFGLAALSFFLPFVTAGCDNRTTARGIDFVTGHEPLTFDESGNVTEPEQTSADEDVPEVVVREGAPAATLALAFVVGAALVALIPAAAAMAASLTAGVFALAALALFLLGLELRLEGVVADLRAGFWLAVLLTGTGTVLARRSCAAAATPEHDPRRSARLVAAGAGLLVLAMVVPHVAAGRGEEDEPLSLAFFWLWGLSPGSRASGAWAVAAFVLLAYLVAVTSLLIARSRVPEGPAAAAAALGLAGVLLAAEGIGYFSALDGLVPGDGLWIQLGGAALALVGGVFGARSPLGTQAPVPIPSRVLAVAGALIVVAACVVPYDRGDEDVPVRTLLGAAFDVERWFALAPLGLAVASIVAAFTLTRVRAAGALLGLGAGLAFSLLPLLYAAVENEADESVGSLGPAGIVGLIGAALVVAAGAFALVGRHASGGGEDERAVTVRP